MSAAKVTCVSFCLHLKVHEVTAYCIFDVTAKPAPVKTEAVESSGGEIAAQQAPRFKTHPQGQIVQDGDKVVLKCDVTGKVLSGSCAITPSFHCFLKSLIKVLAQVFLKISKG